MRRINSIRLFFVIFILFGSIAFAFGYRYFLQQPQQIKEIEKEQIVDGGAAAPITPGSIESQAKTVDYNFIIYEKDGYIVVYRADGITVYSETDITFNSLADSLQEEIRQGKTFRTEEELYSFLESHSS